MARVSAAAHTGAMSRGLAAQRVLRDIDVVARAGLPTEEFLEESLASLQRALPHAGACVANLDPSTHLNTGAHKFGEIRGSDEHDREWADLEFLSGDPTAMAAMARDGVEVVGMHAWAGRHDGHSPRMAEFFAPYFGYVDEARVVLRDGDQVWGGMSLVRSADHGHFDDADLELLRTLAAPMALGLRTGLLARLAASAVPAVGPAVLVVAADDTIQSVSDNAEARLAELLSASVSEPMGTIASLVGAARRYAAGDCDRPPRCRLRGRSGAWLVLHATTLTTRDGAGGDVVITIDEARPPEVLPLVVAAFDLTPRERDVALHVIQGLETREIATRLHVSAYTVQDHLKSIFDKAGVRSRRELIARIWFDQYVPRVGSDLAPTGWFVDAPAD
jgi:DNA-binding NarL/FixJ family response regulator